jgi:hypothetical protein
MACCGRGPKTALTPDEAIVLGRPDGNPARYRVTVTMDGLAVGEEGWFSGADRPIYVAKGILVPVS